MIDLILHYTSQVLAFGAALVIGLLISVLVFAILVRIASLIRNLIGSGVDDTDAGSHRRSGLRLYTDHGTGVQYLSPPRGGLCVRVRKDGSPVVNQEK